MVARSEVAARVALGGGGGAAAPILLWDHDFKAMPDTDWYGVSSATLSTLPVTLTDAGGGAFVWGPLGGLGMTCPAGAPWGRIRVNWSDVSALMGRTLESTDSLAFVCQNAVASTAPTVNNSHLTVEFIGADGVQVAYGGLANRTGTPGQNLTFQMWNGFSPATTPTGGSLVGLRTVTAILTQDVVHYYGSDQAVTTDEPPYGTGPYIIRPAAAVTATDGTVTAATSSKVWDFTNASFMWFMINPQAGESVPLRLEHAQIWLIPGTPNE